MAERRRLYEIKLIIVLAIISALLFGLFFGGKALINAKEAREGDALKSAQLTGTAISVEISSPEENFTLQRDGIDWSCEQHPDANLRNASCGIFADIMINFSAERVLDDSKDMFTEFGFTDDARHITLTTTDGTKEYIIGNYNTALDQYYITYVGTDKAFLISRQYGEVLLRDFDDLLEKEKEEETTEDVEEQEVEIDQDILNSLDLDQ